MARPLNEIAKPKQEYVTKWVGGPGKDGYAKRIPVNTNMGISNETNYDQIDEDALILELAENNPDVLSELVSKHENVFEPSASDQIKFAIKELTTHPQVASILPPGWQLDKDIRYKVAQLVQKHYGYNADEVVKHI